MGDPGRPVAAAAERIITYAAEHETPERRIVVNGAIGPRGDAYKSGRMSAAEAEAEIRAARQDIAERDDTIQHLRVELDSLDEDDMYAILTVPANALTRQAAALLASEGVELHTVTRCPRA